MLASHQQGAVPPPSLLAAPCWARRPIRDSARFNGNGSFVSRVGDLKICSPNELYGRSLIVLSDWVPFAPRCEWMLLRKLEITERCTGKNHAERIDIAARSMNSCRIAPAAPNAIPSLLNPIPTSKARYRKAFVECSVREQDEILTLIAFRRNAESDNELTQGVEFFSLLRNMTADGFFTSKIGKYLGYKGNTYLRQFPGCPPGLDFSCSCDFCLGNCGMRFVLESIASDTDRNHQRALRLNHIGA